MWHFFLGTLSQNSQKVRIRGLSSNLSQNFGQILTRALGLTTLSELYLEVDAPRFEEIQGRQRGRQQTLAFRYRRRSPTELGYRGECPPHRALPVLSLRLSIWSGSAFRDVAASKTAYRCQVRTPYNKNFPHSIQSIFEISTTLCWWSRAATNIHSRGAYCRRYTRQHLGKESCTLINPWWPSKVASVTGTTLRHVLSLCRRTLGS